MQLVDARFPLEAVFYVFPFWRALRHLGGAGLLAMGLLDSSVLPTFGGLDALTLLLAARHKELWAYYGLMSTIGSVVGACITYHVASSQGHKVLLKRFSPVRLSTVQRFLSRWGAFAICIPAFMPPPFPVAPFVIGAGITHYPFRKFVVALACGRAVRYMGLAYLAYRFGRRWTAALWNHPQALIMALVLACGIVIPVALGVILKRVGFKNVMEPPQAIERPDNSGGDIDLEKGNGTVKF